MTVRILQGDCREVLKTLPDDSVHCCVTSPPYWGLRSYLPEGHPSKPLEIGSEPTLQEWVDTMVAVFREVRRVLRPDGTLWLNIGEAYAGSGRGGNVGNDSSGLAGKQPDHSRIAQIERKAAGKHAGVVDAGQTGRYWVPPPDGLKAKDLIGLPWRAAFALQQPYYTGKIKREVDREWLAAMIDGEGCFFIHKRKAGSKAHSRFTRADGSEANYTRTADTFGVGLEISNTNKAIIDRVQAIAGGTITTQGPQQNARRKQLIYRWRVAPNEAKRIAQEVYPHMVGKQHQARILFSCPSSGEEGSSAHMAMMELHKGRVPEVDFPPPPSLFQPGWYLRQAIIWEKPNCMPESVSDRCTNSYEHVFLLAKSTSYYFDAEAIAEDVAASTVSRLAQDVEGQAGSQRANGGTKSNGPMKAVGDGVSRNARNVWRIPTSGFKGAHFATFPPALAERCITAGCPIGGVVLDPFGGSGTVGLVADRQHKDAILIDLDERNMPMAQQRIAGDSPLFADVEVSA